jgi:hypothetical protein
VLFDTPGVDGCILPTGRPVQLKRIDGANTSILVKEYHDTVQKAGGKGWTDVLVFATIRKIAQADQEDRWAAKKPKVPQEAEPSGGVVGEVLVDDGKGGTYKLPVPK